MEQQRPQGVRGGRESFGEAPDKSLSLNLAADDLQLSPSAGSSGNLQLDATQPENDQDGDFQIPLHQEQSSEKMKPLTDELPKLDEEKCPTDVNYAVTSLSQCHLGFRLDLQAMTEISKMRLKFGEFTYYVLPGSKIVIHTEDGTAKENFDAIKSQIGQLARRCNQDSDVEIWAIDRSFEAKLCGIGAKLDVDDMPQTIGMYLQHEDIVYWVSVAHNLLPDDARDSTFYLSEAVDRLHRADSSSRKVCLVEDSEVLGGLDNPKLVRSPTPYACFSCNPMSSVTGQLLFHYVDLMIGPVPVQASHVETGRSCYDGGSMHTVYSPCSSCGMDGCADEGHTPGGKEYSIVDVLHLEKIAGDTSAYYDAMGLVGQVLHCRPQGQNVVTGRVEAYQNGVAESHRDGRNHRSILHNVLMIMPTGRISPKVGDCGSIWVLKGKGLAVAITVGMGKMEEVSGRNRGRSRWVWLAALLHPSLDAFCAAHPCLFPKVDGFKVVRPKASTEFTDPSTSVRSLHRDSGFRSVIESGITSASRLLSSPSP